MDLDNDGSPEWVTNSNGLFRVYRLVNFEFVAAEADLTKAKDLKDANNLKILSIKDDNDGAANVLYASTSWTLPLYKVQATENSRVLQFEFKPYFITKQNVGIIRASLEKQDGFNKIWPSLLCFDRAEGELQGYFDAERYHVDIRIAAAKCLSKKAINATLVNNVRKDQAIKVRQLVAKKIGYNSESFAQDVRLVEAVRIWVERESRPDVIDYLLRMFGCPEPSRSVELIEQHSGWVGRDLQTRLHKCLAKTGQAEWYLKGLLLAKREYQIDEYVWYMKKHGMRPTGEHWSRIVAPLAAHVETIINQHWMTRKWGRGLRRYMAIIGRIRSNDSAKVLYQWVLKYGESGWAELAFFELQAYPQYKERSFQWALKRFEAAKLKDQWQYRQALRYLGAVGTDESRAILQTHISTPTKRAPYGYDNTAVEALNMFPTEGSDQFLRDRCKLYLNHFPDGRKMTYRSYYQLRTICKAAEARGALNSDIRELLNDRLKQSEHYQEYHY